MSKFCRLIIIKFMRKQVNEADKNEDSLKTGLSGVFQNGF